VDTDEEDIEPPKDDIKEKETTVNIGETKMEDDTN
jgi:hypothetical protein